MRSEDLTARRPRRARDVSLREVRDAIDELLRRAMDRASCASPTGFQLEHIREQTENHKPIPGAAHPTGDEHLWRRHKAAAVADERYALLCLVWSRLSLEEQAVVMHQRKPVGCVRVVVAIRIGDYEAASRRGADMIGPRWRNPDANMTETAPDGCVFVSELRPVFPSQSEVAEQMGLSRDRVRRAITRTYDVWREALADTPITEEERA